MTPRTETSPNPAPTVARITPADIKEMSTEKQRTSMKGWDALHFNQVMMRSPGLFKTFLPLLSRLVAESELPAHDRQVLVLRTCELTGEVYEATHHVLISRASGLSGEQIEAAQTGIGLSPVHTLLAAAAQELVTDFSVSDTTWNGLAEHYSDIELMDIVALVAVYTFMATLTRGLGIQLEDDETIESFVALREYT